MNDEAIAERLRESHGIGVPIFDEESDPSEIAEIFRELGLAD